MKLKEKVKSAGKFVKDHKIQFIVGGVTVVCVIVGGRLILKRNEKIVEKKAMSLINKIVNNFDAVARNVPKEFLEVDEQVFTELAPEIEEMILSEFCEDGLIDQTYKFANGIAKQVVVTVKKV